MVSCLYARSPEVTSSAFALEERFALAMPVGLEKTGQKFIGYIHKSASISKLFILTAKWNLCVLTGQVIYLCKTSDSCKDQRAALTFMPCSWSLLVASGLLQKARWILVWFSKAVPTFSCSKCPHAHWNCGSSVSLMKVWLEYNRFYKQFCIASHLHCRSSQYEYIFLFWSLKLDILSCSYVIFSPLTVFGSSACLHMRDLVWREKTIRGRELLWHNIMHDIERVVIDTIIQEIGWRFKTNKADALHKIQLVCGLCVHKVWWHDS